MKSKMMILATTLLALSLGVNAEEKKSTMKLTAEQMAVVVKRNYSTTTRSTAYKKVVAEMMTELKTREFDEQQLKKLRLAVVEISKAEKHATNSLIALMDARGGDPRAYARPHKLVNKMIQANRMRLNRAMTWNILERYSNVLINGKIWSYIDIPVEGSLPTSTKTYIGVLRMSKVVKFQPILNSESCDLVAVRFLNKEGRSVSSFAMQPKQLPADVNLVKEAEFVEIIGGNLSKKVYDSGPRLVPTFKQRIHIQPMK